MNINTTRFTQDFLKKYQKKPPSFTIHLYHDHWFLNNAKFSYSNQCSSILEDIRAFRIPVDFLELFDQARVPYYEGRLIVELLDYRSPNRSKAHIEKPDPHRVVLQANDETLWADVLLMNAKNGNKWTDRNLIEIEASVINAVGPPLCLDPDLNLSRIVNTMIRTTSQGIPPSLKRKQPSELEEDETERIKRTKTLQFMNPKFGKPNQPRSYKLQKFFGDAKKNYERAQVLPQQVPVPPPLQPQQQPPPPPPQPVAPAPSDPTPAAPSSTPVPTIQNPQPPAPPPLAVLAIQQEVKKMPKRPRKRSENGKVSPASNGIPQARRQSLIQNGSSESGTPRDSAEQSPAATPVAPTPTRPPSILPPQPEEASSTVGVTNGNFHPQPPASQARPPQTAANVAGFQPPMPPREFLQPPPQGPRRKPTAVQPITPIANHNIAQHQHQMLSQANPSQTGQPQQSIQPNNASMNPALSQMYAQSIAQRYMAASNPSSSPIAQNMPARTSPMTGPVARPSPHLTGQNIARNSPHLVPQQLAQQRGSPLANGQSTPNHSPMPGNPQLPPQQPIPQPQNPAQALQAPNFNALAARYTFQGQALAGQVNQHMGMRTGTPQQGQAPGQGQQMQRPQMPQQQIPPGYMHPLNYAQLQQMGNYPPAAWRTAVAAAGRGVPQNLQQQQQQFMVANGGVPITPAQMMGRGMGAKRVPGR